MPTHRDFELPVDIPKKSELVQQKMRWMVLLVFLAIVAFIMFLLSIQLGVVMAEGAKSLPDIRILANYHPNQSTQIFDRHNNLLANIHGDEDRVVVPLKDISPNIQRAVMAIEDNRFYQHNGVDVRGTFRAFATNIKGGDIQGGSTLTQQLVKNLFLSPERSYSRKIAEAVLALRVERHYTKDKILEMYLNQVYWGNHAYGIEKAAKRYFKKSAKELSVPEAALLAGLLKAPEGLSPYRFPEAARGRQLAVLAKMEQYGYITPQQAKEARDAEVTLKGREVKPSKHPYFVAHVIQELMALYGEDVVRRGGLKVYTTVDSDIQSAAEEALEKAVKGLPEYTHVTNGALISIDVPTGEIMALVGGVDFSKSQFNNATQAYRAAGSQFKPFVYLTGFRLGMITPESPISDKPISFNTGVSIWKPKNWDGRFMGAMTIRKALTLSRNTPTVQIGMRVGIEEVIRTARLAGIESPIDPNFASLLGSSGVPPIEMATAFATFARGGVRMNPTAIRRVENVQGESLPFDKPVPRRTLDGASVSQLNSILVDVVEKGTGRSAQLPERTVAGKTGTTDKVRDIWFTGYTPDMVATVWMGNEKYVPLKGVFSSNAAKVWHDYAEAYYAKKPVKATDFMAADKNAEVKSGSMMVLDAAPPRPEPEMPDIDLPETPDTPDASAPVSNSAPATPKPKASSSTTAPAAAPMVGPVAPPAPSSAAPVPPVPSPSVKPKPVGPQAPATPAAKDD